MLKSGRRARFPRGIQRHGVISNGRAASHRKCRPVAGIPQNLSNGHSMHKCVPVNVTVTVSFMLNMSVSFICRTVYFCGDTTIESIKNLSSLAIQQQFVAIENIQFNKVRFHSIYIWYWLWLHTCARDQFIVAWPIRRLCSLTVTLIIIRSKMSDYCRLDFCFFFLSVISVLPTSSD